MLFLLACAEKEEESSVLDACRGTPSVSILAPAEGAELTYGERVELQGEGTSTIDESLVFLWGVAGDVVSVGQNGAWVPDVSGAVEITLQAEDSCGSSQTAVNVTVLGGDSG